MKKKLIKRLEELAIENEQLKSENNKLAWKLLEKDLEKTAMSIQKNIEKQSIPDSSQDFKKGDILIREWKEKDVFNFCTFEEKLSDNSFKCTDYCKFIGIIKKDEIKNYVAHYELDMSIYSLRYNWRKATQKEIEELNKLLGKEEPKEEEVWWLCKKSMGYYFTKYKKYKQISYNENTITFINDLGSEHNVYKNGLFGWFTKVEENKELEEAIGFVKGYTYQIINNRLKKSIETILKHLDK